MIVVCFLALKRQYLARHHRQKTKHLKKIKYQSSTLKFTFKPFEIKYKTHNKVRRYARTIRMDSLIRCEKRLFRLKPHQIKV